MNMLKFLFLIFTLRKNKYYLIYSTFSSEPILLKFEQRKFIFFPHLVLKFKSETDFDWYYYRFNLINIKKMNDSDLVLELV